MLGEISIAFHHLLRKLSTLFSKSRNPGICKHFKYYATILAQAMLAQVASCDEDYWRSMCDDVGDVVLSASLGTDRGGRFCDPPNQTISDRVY